MPKSKNQKPYAPQFAEITMEIGLRQGKLLILETIKIL